jgi:membrane-associated phospholipid phosphatase
MRPLLGRASVGAACAYLLATLLAFVTQQELQTLLQHEGSRAVDAIARLADYLGSGMATVGFGLAALAFGRLARKPAWVDAALALGVAGIPCWLLTIAGQFVLAESRSKDGGAMHWFTLGGHGVSGHAAAAALVFWTVRGALVRDAEAPVRRVATAALLGWALLVGWSRVYLGEHFVWNVMLGYFVGTVGVVISRRSARALP